ncbi:MAG: methyltransferase domain-containing protein [Alphaproteobacteria bacterium]|nr:methyltransferase domain-containing protein [Alphaproteobacteria bacterium]
MATNPSNRAPREAVGAASRVAAGELLFSVVETGADLETALGAVGSYARLEGSDRAFARAIASAALRGLGRIDYALGGLVDRPLEKVEAPLRALLRAGCAQLWLLGVAEHAAVSATVDAARDWRATRRGGGLVNAVLRRAAGEAGRDAFASAPATSVWPDWLAARIKAALGEARADALARLQLDEPPLDLTLKPGIHPETLAEQCEGEALPNGSVRLPAGATLTELPGYASGDWWVQDAGASLAAKLLGDVAGFRVADLCAAPGGKALQLAAAGAHVTAIDISRQRLALVRENAARVGASMDIIEADAREWRPAAPLDAVLLDAPCSALGVLRRHPEGAWRRDPAGLARFPKAQAALLAAAGDMLKPGGRLVYCVCTPNPEEGREIVDAAVVRGGWRRVPVAAKEVPGFTHALTHDGDVITAPPVCDAEAALSREIVAEPVNSDVFYVSRLERTG